MSDEQLPGRVALVTGASSGIGRATATALARAGAAVAVGAHRADRLQDLARERRRHHDDEDHPHHREPH